MRFLVIVLLGTLWSSIKQNEARYVFDWENAIDVPGFILGIRSFGQSHKDDRI